MSSISTSIFIHFTRHVNDCETKVTLKGSVESITYLNHIFVLPNQHVQIFGQQALASMSSELDTPLLELFMCSVMMQRCLIHT